MRAAGYSVVLLEVEQRFLDRGLAAITKNLEREAAKGKITAEEQRAALARITPTLDREELAGCDLVVEAASERFEIKAGTLPRPRRTLPPERILASNTSSISITKTGGADQAAREGHRHALLQSRADDEARGGGARPGHQRRNVRRREGLWHCKLEQDSGRGERLRRASSATACCMPLINEAIYAVMEGVATPEAVDEVFKLGMAHPMGPLTLADFIGLDVCLDIMRVMHGGLGDPKYRPCPLLVKMVDAGWLGRKSGRGFYKY